MPCDWEYLVEYFDPIFKDGSSWTWIKAQSKVSDVLGFAFGCTGRSVLDFLADRLFHEEFLISGYAALGIGLALRGTGDEEAIELINRAIDYHKKIKGNIWRYALYLFTGLSLIVWGREDAEDVFQPHLKEENLTIKGRAMFALSLARQKTCDEDMVKKYLNATKKTMGVDDLDYRLFVDWVIMGIGYLCRGSHDEKITKTLASYLSNPEEWGASVAYAISLVNESSGNINVLRRLRRLNRYAEEICIRIPIASTLVFNNIGEEAIHLLKPLEKWRYWTGYSAIATGLASALKGKENAEAEEILKTYLTKKRSTHVKMFAGYALSQMYRGRGDKVIDELTQLAKSRDYDVRGWAIYMMGTAYQRTWKEDIIEYMDDLVYCMDWGLGTSANICDAYDLAKGRILQGIKDKNKVNEYFPMPYGVDLADEFRVMALADTLTNGLNDKIYDAMLLNTDAFYPVDKMHYYFYL